jgi:hypothetical protein
VATPFEQAAHRPVFIGGVTFPDNRDSPTVSTGSTSNEVYELSVPITDSSGARCSLIRGYAHRP